MVNELPDSALHATLASIVERISQMERQLMELRQFLLIHLPCSGWPENELPRPPAPIDPIGAGSGTEERWDVTLLGRFQLRCAGREPAPCTSRRGLAILKYLLTAPHYAATAGTLIECFWPGTDPEAGAHNLQMAIHALRRSLRGCGPGGSDKTVLYRNERYFLNPALIIRRDVDSFRDAYERGQGAARVGRMTEACHAFEEARNHYGGDYLADSLYDDWTAGHRAAFQDMWLTVLSRLGSAYIQASEWDRAASCCREILALDPYREDAYRQLMRCQAAMGCLADVQRTYRACQERLSHDLHVSPAPRTMRLYQQLIRQVLPVPAH